MTGKERLMPTSVGFRIFKNITRPDPGLVEKFKGIPTSNINDEMNRMYNSSAAISPLNKVTSFAGPAFTVKAPIGDNLMFHKALDLAEPGDVIIVDGAGAMDRSLAGEIMMTFAELKGIAAVVVDGALRDFDALCKMSMPIYCKGITPQGPFKHGPGEINVPVCCGGVVVNPGDIIVGDPDGIVVIRPEDSEAVLSAAQKKLAGETAKLSKYHALGPDYEEHAAEVSKSLEAKGVVYC